MKIKYYLRGLGLGLIVSALILGVHFGRKSDSMTDAQIKERAAELGMVDGSATLTSGTEDLNAEELLETINSDKKENDESQDEADINNENVSDTGEVSTDEIEEKLEELEETTAQTKQEIEAVIDADDDPDKVGTDDAKIDSDTGNDTDNEPVKEETKPSADTAKTVELTISSGDSSYRVAQKLTELGLVDDASDYDSYLCNNGYDRYIRTGTYTFTTDDTNEKIAKTITGK